MMRRAERLTERMIASLYLISTGPELPRPWVLMVDESVLARCTEQAPLRALQREVGGALAYEPVVSDGLALVFDLDLDDCSGVDYDEDFEC